MLIKIYEEAVDLLKRNEAFVMATVITSDGSTPRGPGAKMIIREDGSITGTIGGGPLEASVMRRASEALKEKRAYVEAFHLNKDDLSMLGMICGGDLEVLIDYIDPSDADYLHIYTLVLGLYRQHKPSYIVTLVPSTDIECSQKKQFILMEDDSTPESALCSPDYLKPFISKGVSYKVVKYEENKRAILEAINVPHRVYIFGAGHVGEKLAWILHFVGFHTSVLDDRPEFANSERFPYADIRMIGSFDRAFEALEIDRYSFIVIVTRGHVHDGTVLAAALKTVAGYIGMIGSRRKRDGIYRRLLDSGFSESDLKRVHSPIGLPIGDETPEEIAVSITAELIKVRSEMK